MVLLAALVALEVGHVLHEAHHRHLQRLRQVHGLTNDHGHKLLGSRHGDDAIDGQRLEDRQEDVGSSRRHVDEHVVHIAPVHLLPELLDGAGDDRAAPGHGHVALGQHEVHGHDLDAAGGFRRVDAVGVSGQAAIDAEGLRDGRAGDVGIQNGHLVAALVHLGGEQAGDEGLAHAALAGHDADHMLDVGALVGRQGGRAGLGGAVAAAGDAAAGALVRAFFCHDSFFLFSSGRALRDQGSSQGIIAQTPRHPFDTSGFLNVVRTKDRPLRKPRTGA